MKKHYLLVVIVMLLINFFLPRLMPGDPFLYLSVEDGSVSTAYSQQQIDQYKAYYGLDQPLPAQFWNYLTQLFRGNLGYSIYYNTSVAQMIFSRIPWTLFIVVSSLLLSSVIGTAMGAVSAWMRDQAADRVMYFVMIVISEIPAFLLGVLFLFVFAAQMKWFPLSGGSTVFASFDSIWAQIGDILHHAFLPILTLTLTRVGGFFLLSRNSMLTVLSKDYIRTAKAKGIGKRKVIFRHALKNALPPVVSSFFMSLGTLFGGAVLVENVFAYPGIGRLMREAVNNRDYVLIQGIFLTITIMVLLMNWLAELIHKKLDPRVG
ncbi:ABC transporter permease [Oscillospiraceae bacterium MB08-C2-2]|nr:ABC transporter permease [Oscillospiraceae bacterium MB08-C2-2]